MVEGGLVTGRVVVGGVVGTRVVSMYTCVVVLGIGGTVVDCINVGTVVNGRAAVEDTSNVEIGEYIGV